MIAPAKPLLDHHGKPFAGRSARRQALQEFFADARPRRVEGTYDAARDSTEFQNYWANSDKLDADSAHSKDVRHKLISRSRYEVGNNGYADGIAQTYATDVVGLGPSLRMQTASHGFNQLVETEFRRWCKAVQFRRKLWCLAHAKHTDGEGFAVLRKNARVGHPVQLDWVLHEAEQCQTPLLPYQDGYIDGIEFDKYGNPLSYDFLRHHPGATGYMSYDMYPERVAAKFVAHWYKMRRPGQHRGVPESASTLNTGAAARRWREATVAAAENIADFSIFIRTAFQPDQLDTVAPMDTLNIQKRMMTALPQGWDAFQPKAEQPTATYEMFHRSLINEQARPTNMPFNKAAADSSDYNYASGRLDHQTYYAALDVDRADCDDSVLEPLFKTWFEFAVMAFGWLGGNPDALSPGAISHLWDWPKHRVADVKTEADSNRIMLSTGEQSLDSLATSAGEDYEDKVAAEAASNGMSVDQQKQINFLRNLPQHVLASAERILGIAPTPQGAINVSDE